MTSCRSRPRASANTDIKHQNDVAQDHNFKHGVVAGCKLTEDRLNSSHLQVIFLFIADRGGT